MADSVQSALQLLQSGAAPIAPQPQAQDPVASALSQLQGTKPFAEPVPLNIGVAGLPQAVRDVAGDFSPFTHEAVGAKALWDAAAMKLKTALGGTLTPEEQASQAANSALLESSGPARAGNIAASLAAVPIGEASLALPAASALAKVPLLGKLFSGAVIGGTTAAATSPDNSNLGLGELAGAAGGAAAGAIGRIAQPIMQSPAVRKLTSSGVIPTIGQAGGKFTKSVEDRLTSIPGVGDFIKNAQGRAVQELNRAAIQEAAPEVTAVGREGLRQAEASVGKMYDKALSNITVKADQSLIPHLESFADSKRLLMSAEQRASVRSLINSTVADSASKGTIPGEIAKKIDAELGAKAASLQSSSSTSEREMGKAIQNAQMAFRQQMAKGASRQEAADLLNEANSRYAKIVRLQRATASGKEGVFTPGQLQSAVRQSDRSVRKAQFAKGNANMQDLSEPAVSVLGDRYPDSGTAGRAMLAMLALGGAGGAGANEYFHGPHYLTALALAPLTYSRIGSRYLLGDYALQKAIGPQIGTLAPYAAGSLGALSPQIAAALSQYTK